MSQPDGLHEVASVLTLARSFLFVPANRPERYAKALASGAGAVIIDLEDAIGPEQKPAARVQLEESFALLGVADRDRVVIRINAAGTVWHADDLALVGKLAHQGLAGVVLPKAESPGQLAHLAASVGQACALLPMIETAAGLAAIDDIARSPQVARLLFGNLDFQADLGMACGPDEAELQPVRLALVMASRRAGLATAVDGVTPGTGDLAQVQADAERSRRSGLGARLCIHPQQVPVVNAALGPTAAEIDWASRVLAQSSLTGGSVFTLDGRMVDEPLLRKARHVLAQQQFV
ncbi:MAG: CoA ester lyase [Polaromonas sp. 39-63-203]|jgi:citrate lyase subunit beta/citryl-CoA lyase|uniref:HpcH/HpaI aldolase/citrate lyase family protein n=1 Tax=Polaromonas sp. TaxID=1869339 RepID=UPI000BD0BF1C|nr:CoA ester lyase [Polaromonas sp.]OYY52770.1 MAG: CoA ester lyase [Polaromonas sp. 35-63-240]OYZ83988.1 MAG: CoA ester lyase [Polaromonas sp. 24-62-144]OZA98719.1 MAG: CoA ester lyase [Polaromonas sp. 39-63-203]HQS31870.1 CoA ester lyase [Polaromonas sp.]HQS92558.1 CoA ester lyase [Polaromonas sp.]